MAPAADFSEQYYLRLLERRPASVFFVPAGALLARFVRAAVCIKHRRDEHRGLFKQLTLNRGRPMAPASETS
jgi:hypothetical protein